MLAGNLVDAHTVHNMLWLATSLNCQYRQSTATHTMCSIKKKALLFYTMCASDAIYFEVFLS